MPLHERLQRATGIGYLGDIGVPPDDLPMDFIGAWFEAYLRRALEDVRRAPQHAAHRTHSDGVQATLTDVAIVTSFGPSLHARELQGDDR